MPLPPRAIPHAALLAALLAPLLATAACSPRQAVADQAEATCRDQAIRDTSELPGIVADTARDRMVRRCLAAPPP